MWFAFPLVTFLISHSLVGAKSDQHEYLDTAEAASAEEDFSEVDLIEMVTDLEHQADLQETTGIFPEILDVLHGNKKSEEEGVSNITLYKTGVVHRTINNDTLRISLHPPGSGESAEETPLTAEEIAEGISEGVEEYLRMSDDLILNDEDCPPNTNATGEERQFPLYLFQGEYYAEPRLNRFIDGALRNMASELRLASMDPLYFRVLPRGHVVESPVRISGGGGIGGIRRRRPGAAAALIRKRRQLPAFFRMGQLRQKNKRRPQKTRLKVPGGITRVTNVSQGLSSWFNRGRLTQQQQRRRRQKLRNQRIKQQLKNRLKKQQQQQQNQNKNNKRKQQILLNRIRRRIRQDVGGGRIEGLSKVERDGDAEMQLFGNYTLIRSHMKMGPVEITMQFRTRNGIRRSGATLAVIRAHTVTRVNHEGSEMVDYLLDRPHPESIRVRGTLYPLAQKVARNIFARLFLPNSFLVSRLREKASLAFLSKPVIA